MRQPRPRQGSLTIIGTGIQLGQMSLEARARLQTADKVLFLVADPVTSRWICGLNSSAESLQHFYRRNKDRLTSYHEMIERILECVRSGLDVCVAFYGHPGVFVYPSHEALRQARQEGFAVSMLPGISAQDCLFADLGIDPARTGCQSYDATDFLLSRRRPDPCSGLLLWQPSVVGEPGYRTTANRRGLRLLTKSLLRSYAPGHEVTLYEAAPYPLCKPHIVRLPLAKLPQARVTSGCTLFIPPARKAVPDRRLMKQLGIAGARTNGDKGSHGGKCICFSTAAKRGSERKRSQPGSTRSAISKRSRSDNALPNQKKA
jgi:precorrin-6B methylase 1